MRDNRLIKLRRVVAGAAAGAFLFAASVASAQTDNKAIAESLFQEGRKLMAQGKYSVACRKLEASMRLDPAAGTQLNMAVCHEKEGKIATAWSEFKDATVAARREGRADRAAFARQHVKALEPQLPKLVIVVSKQAAVPGLKIVGGGTPLVSAVWGTEVPINPGPETIEAHAKGYKPWKTQVTFHKGQTTRVVIPTLEKAPLPPPKPKGGEGLVPGTQKPQPFWTTDREIGAVLGGVGVVAVGVGGYFGITALSKHSDSNNYCTDTTCSSQHGIDLNNEAKKNARFSDIFMGVGAVAVVTGVVLMATGGTSSGSDGEMKTGQSKPLHFEVGMGPRSASVGMAGAW